MPKKKKSNLIDFVMPYSEKFARQKAMQHGLPVDYVWDLMADCAESQQLFPCFPEEKQIIENYIAVNAVRYHNG